MQTTALARIPLQHNYNSVKLNWSFAFKDAVIGSSIVAPVVFAQRGKKRSEQRNSALVTLAQRGKRPPKQTLQRIVLPPQILQVQLVTVNLDLFRAAMAVQKLANGWRARRKKDGKTFNGPLRATEVAANEDARQM